METNFLVMVTVLTLVALTLAGMHSQIQSLLGSVDFISFISSVSVHEMHFSLYSLFATYCEIKIMILTTDFESK